MCFREFTSGVFEDPSGAVFPRIHQRRHGEVIFNEILIDLDIINSIVKID